VNAHKLAGWPLIWRTQNFCVAGWLPLLTPTSRISLWNSSFLHPL